MSPPPPRKKQGFTLIELSIVLVIIGLIVGGVLVGQDLIKAAATRAQISQIEKYNTAANTFYVKYGYLPGDIPDPYASQFGFQARGLYAGEGDGNGILEGVISDGPGNNQPWGSVTGETTMFWADLSTAGFIDGMFNTASPHIRPSGLPITGTNLNLYLPQATLGNGNYIYPFSGEVFNGSAWVGTGKNYFSIEGVYGLNVSGAQVAMSLSVQQAYNIDKKIDDGIPTTGSVQAFYVNYINNRYDWANGNVNYYGTPDTTATLGSPTTCYDNGGVAGQQHYSMEISNGSGLNCALSFRMQGAAR